MNKKVVFTFGFFTDVHARADSPDSRTDDYRSAILNKLEEIGDIFKNNDVSVALFGGDMFHSPDPARSIEHDVTHVLKSWQLPIWGVIGSHDYFGYQMKSLKRTAMGLLRKHGVVDLIDSTGEHGLDKFFRTKSGAGGPDVIVTANRHTWWLVDDVDNLSTPRHHSADEDVVQIQMVHGDLVVDPVPWPHVTLEQTSRVIMSDVVLSGHYHPGWLNPVRLGDSLYFNPGSVGRTENSGKVRIPRVCIVRVFSDKTIAIVPIDLESAEQHPFSEKLKKDVDYAVQDVNRLVSIMMDKGEVDVIDLKQEIPVVVKELGFDDRVMKKSFEFLDKLK